jgi:hypothetical protein
MHPRLPAVVLVAAIALAVISSNASAQVYTGRIDVVVEDTTGSRLPGVTLTLSGQLPGSAVSDVRGEAHFLNLPVGSYTLGATLQNFDAWTSKAIAVESGGSVSLAVSMAVAGTSEEVSVTAQMPVLDTKKQTTAVNVGLDELQSIPSARDPWVVMQSVPGIVMDRVNVGGNESGQQSGFMGKGTGSGNATWNLDGVPITDMSSLSSPFYYDFDMFQEIGIVTGGADPKSATGGVQLNFVLKSGTNTLHGQLKGYLEDPAHLSWMQSENVTPELAAQLASEDSRGDRTDQYSDWGGDIGGPVLRDRWWFWGAWGQQDIRLRKISGVTDRTLLQNASFKTEAQVTRAIRTSFSFFQAEKKKWGRNAGPFVAQEASQDQLGADGPNRTYKVESNGTLGSSLFLVGRYAHLKQGFQLIPEGGMDAVAYVLEDRVARGSTWAYTTRRPSDSIALDGNAFKGRHEVKFGFSWRRAEVHSTSSISHDYFSDATAGYLMSGGGYPYIGVYVSPAYAADAASSYWSAYVGDTISLHRMTVNAGLRYDRQSSSVLPSTEAALKMAPNLLPEINAPGVSDGVVYSRVQPRVGLTMSLDQARKTQVRATYAMFTDQLSIGAASFLSVAQYRWFYLDAKDLNGDHIAQENEFLWNTYAEHIAYGDYGGYDPTKPGTAPTAFNKAGAYTVPTTHEIIVGFDRELAPNVAVAASYTWRRNTNFNWRPIISGAGYIDATDYVLMGNVVGELPSNVPGSPQGTYSVPYYALKAGTSFDPARGIVFTERPGYHQAYHGLEISATKRMSNHWMARAGFATSRWREYFDGPGALGDPTPRSGAPNVNGGDVVIQSGVASLTAISMIQPRYQATASAAVQLPYDVDLGASLMFREGFGIPWARTTTGGYRDPLGSSKTLLLTYPDYSATRFPSIGTLDVRFGKRQRVGKITFNFDLDAFNILNSSTVQGRQNSMNSTEYTKVSKILSPRIWRFGLRVQF